MLSSFTYSNSKFRITERNRLLLSPFTFFIAFLVLPLPHSTHAALLLAVLFSTIHVDQALCSVYLIVLSDPHRICTIFYLIDHSFDQIKQTQRVNLHRTLLLSSKPRLWSMSRNLLPLCRIAHCIWIYSVCKYGFSYNLLDSSASPRFHFSIIFKTLLTCLSSSWLAKSNENLLIWRWVQTK